MDNISTGYEQWESRYPLVRKVGYVYCSYPTKIKSMDESYIKLN